LHPAIAKRIRLANFEAKFQLKADFRRHWESVWNVGIAAAFGSRAVKAAAHGEVTGPELDELFAKQDGKCAEVRCASILVTTGEFRFHWDHKIPLSRGGSNWITNIQALCPHCNLCKRAKTMEEFAATKWTPGPDYRKLRLAELAYLMKPIKWHGTGTGNLVSAAFAVTAKKALAVATAEAYQYDHNPTVELYEW